MLLNEQKITLSVEFGAAGGVAVSPNSRVLYVATAKRIDQFDLEAPDIGGSRITVAEFDSTVMSCHNWSYYYFFLGQLAPDGKIYFSVPYNMGDTYHVIDYPDSLGLGCSARVHGFPLGAFTYMVPNHPNYYLGALPNPCPTVSNTAPFGSAQGAGIKVYPNPAGSVVNVEIGTYGSKACLAATVSIMDLQGRVVLRQTLTEGKTAISVGNLGEGVYIYRIKTDKGAYYGKLVIQR